MQKRGLDASVLDQVSAAAPGQQNAPAAVPTTNPQVGGVEQQVAGQAAGVPAGQPKTPFRSAEMEISLKALQNTVNTENKIAEAVLGM